MLYGLICKKNLDHKIYKVMIYFSLSQFQQGHKQWCDGETPDTSAQFSVPQEMSEVGVVKVNPI